MLGSCFVNLSVQHTWRGRNTCANHVASEDIRVYMRVVQEGSFPQRSLQFTLKDISSFMYEKM